MTSLLPTAAFAAIISLCAASDKKDEKPAVSAAEAKPVATAPAVATTGPASETAVTVNGDVITEAQVLETFIAGTRNRPVPAAQRDTMLQRYRPQILNMLIDDQLFQNEATKEKIDVTQEELAKKFQDDLDGYAKISHLSKEEMAEQVKQRTGMEVKDYIAQGSTDPFNKRMFRRAKLIEKKFPEQIKVTDAEIKESYDKNLEKTYKQAAQVRASHILIATRDKTEAEKAELKKKAQEALAEAKKPGADFGELAKKYSDCPSKKDGGDLNFFPREGAMVEPFAAAAFAMKKGDISDLVETQFGYHIIKVTDTREAVTTSLEEATPVIREQIRREKISSEMQKYATELRKDAKIVYPPGKEPATQPAMNLVPRSRPAAAQ